MNPRRQSAFYQETPHAIPAVGESSDGLITLNGTKDLVRLYVGNNIDTDMNFGWIDATPDTIVVNLYPDMTPNLNAETLAAMMAASADMLGLHAMAINPVFEMELADPILKKKAYKARGLVLQSTIHFN